MILFVITFLYTSISITSSSAICNDDDDDNGDVNYILQWEVRKPGYINSRWNS